LLLPPVQASVDIGVVVAGDEGGIVDCCPGVLVDVSSVDAGVVVVVDRGGRADCRAAHPNACSRLYFSVLGEARLSTPPPADVEEGGERWVFSFVQDCAAWPRQSSRWRRFGSSVRHRRCRVPLRA
jgi:hypothetical protein